MELSWIEDFLELVRFGSFSKAAERRHVTQPAFGRRIRALEEWVGTPLFDRSCHQIGPTAAGRAFHPAAEEVLRRLSLGRDQARDAGNAADAALRFASTHLLASTFFPHWLPAIETEAGRDFPFQFVVDNMVACEQLMQRGEVRLLLSHHHEMAPAELDTRTFLRLPLGHDRLVPVSAPDGNGKPLHALRDSNAAIPFLSYRPESGLGRILSRSGLIEPVRNRLKPVFHAHAALTLLAVASAGRGLAWVPLSVAAPSITRGALVPAGGEEWETTVEICLFRPAARQFALLEDFWEYARKRDRGAGIALHGPLAFPVGQGAALPREFSAIRQPEP